MEPDDLRPVAGDAQVVPVSALSGHDLPSLLQAIASLLPTTGVAPETLAVSNSRHVEQLLQGPAALDRAIEAAGARLEHSAVATDLKLAAEGQGDITGQGVTGETISNIFARFCVGK